MKSLLVSIRPKWVEKICHEIGKDENGKAIYEKRIEVRKSAPKEVPFKTYIYCTKGKDGYEWLYRVDNNGYGKAQSWHGKVIGEFVCDKVIRTCGWRLRGDTQQCAKRTVAETELPKLACLTIDEIVDYAGSENREVVGWHISDLQIYDKPKELSEFTRPCSYDGICSSCKRFITNGMPYGFCDSTITRPPQSYMFVEEL